MPPDEKFGSSAKSKAITCFVLFFWLSSIIPINADIDLVMPALGRPASTLGELYDSRTQQFKAVTIFNDNLHPDFITRIDTPFTDAKYWIVDSKKSKLNHLDVSAHLKVDIMSGKLTVEGSAKYFHEPKTSALEVEGFLHYKMRTQRRLLNLFYEDLRCYVKFKTLQELAGNATHIVVGLEYGSDVVIKFTDQAKTQDEKTEIEGKLKLAFTVESVSIDGEAEANITEGSTDSFSNFTLQVYGDINLNPKFILPKNAKEVGALLSSVPQRVRETEDHLGVPMVITLFPLGPLLKLMKVQGMKEALVEDLDESIINDFILIFEKISVVTQELNDLLFQLRYYSNCTSAEDIARVEELKNGFTEAALIFKINVRNAMSAARTRTPYKAIKYKDAEGEEDEESTSESTTEGDTDEGEGDEDEKSSTESSNEENDEKSSTEGSSDEKSSTEGSNEEDEKSSTEGESDDEKKSSTEGESDDEEHSSTEGSSSTTDADSEVPPSPKPTTAAEDDEIVRKLRAKLRQIRSSRSAPLSSSKTPTRPRLRYPDCVKNEEKDKDEITENGDSESSTPTPPEKDKRDILQKVLEQYENSSFYVNKVAVKLERDFEFTLKKIELYKMFQNTGVQYFGRFGLFSNLRFQTVDKIIYAIYMLNTTGEDWNNNWELFQNTLKQNFSILAVVDCAFPDPVCGEIIENSDLNKTVTYQYYAQKLISKDVYSALQKIKNLSFEPLVVSALGKFHKIGDLYSSKRNQFLGRSLLHPGTNTSQLRLTREVYNNETMEIVDNRLLQKFRVMNVQPLDQRYNILIDSRGLQRSGLTFKEKEGYNPRLTSQTLFHIYNTIQEGVLDADENSMDFISIPRLFKGGATHFVQSVVYGGVSSISLSAPIPLNQQDFDLEPLMKRDLRKIKDKLDEKSREATKDVDSFFLDEGCESARALSSENLGPERDLPSTEDIQIKDLDLQRNYSISIASDIFQSSSSQYESERDLLNFLNQFPKNKGKGCNGRGKPVVYVLYPLINLQQYFGVIPEIPDNPIELQRNAGPDPDLGRISGPISFQASENENMCPAEKEFKDITKAINVTRIFETLLDAEGQLSALKAHLKSHSEYVTSAVQDDFDQVREDFYSLKRNITDELRHAVALKTPRELENVVESFNESPLFNTSNSPTPKFIALNKFNNQIQKNQWLSKFRQVFPEVNYLGKGKSLGKEWTNYSSSENVYILFHFIEKAVIDDPVWLENLNLFRGNLARKPYNKLIFLDCDFDDLYCQNLEKHEPVIHLYKNRRQLSSDVLAEWNEAEARLRNRAVSIQRQTLGRENVKIGELYNIRNEKFSGKSIFKSNRPMEDILMEISHDVKVHAPSLIQPDDLKLRYEVMYVEPELQLALMFERIQKEFEFGSGAILDPRVNFSSAIVLKVHSSIWRLNQNSPNLPKYFDPLSILNKEDPDGPTHFIKGVTLGFNMIIALGHSATPKDITVIKNYLAQLEGSTVNVALSDSLGTGVEGLDSEAAPTNLEIIGDFTIYTDLPLNNQHEIHGGDLKNRLNQIKDLIKTTTAEQLLNAKGHSTSIFFELEPIESLQEPLGILVPPYNYTPFSPSFRPQPIVDTYFDYTRALNKLKEKELTLKQKFNIQGMTDESLLKLNNLSEAIALIARKFQLSYRELFEGVKIGLLVESELTENLPEYRKELTPGGEFVQFEEGMRAELDKLVLLEKLGGKQSQSGCEYIGRGKRYMEIIGHGLGTKYVLFVGKSSLENSNSTQAEKWIETTQKFFTYLIQDVNQTQTCFIVDCDFPDNSVPFPICTEISSGPVVYKFSDGEVTSRDYIKEMHINKTNTEEEIDHQGKMIENLKDQIENLKSDVKSDSKTLKEVSSQFVKTSGKLDSHVQEFDKLKKDEAELGTQMKGNFTLLQNSVDKLNLELAKQVPVNFVYVQYPFTRGPSEIWPGFKWEEITKAYADYFFRAEGSSSEKFNSTQEDSTRSLSYVKMADKTCESGVTQTGVFVPRSGHSGYVTSGWWDKKAEKAEWACSVMDFEIEDREVRPKNMAVRIWKRIN